jgi:ATP-dependent RNA circularization protein (DNA/RNA ligase family)
MNRSPELFFRFPHTPHLEWLGEGAPRDDKVLSEREAAALLEAPVVVEEKLDGANLGFSVATDGRLQVQNRGSYLVKPFSGQFGPLIQWLELHEETLLTQMPGGVIVFGEWCAARHSLSYSRLPDWFLVFDVYDRVKKKFWSTSRRNALAAVLALPVVPSLLKGCMTKQGLRDLLSQLKSNFSDGPLEGVVVRREEEQWLPALRCPLCCARATPGRGPNAKAMPSGWTFSTGFCWWQIWMRCLTRVW